jgi:hypothetical protein
VLNHRVKEEKRKESNAACGLVIQVFNTLSTWGKGGGGRGKGREKGKGKRVNEKEKGYVEEE